MTDDDARALRREFDRTCQARLAHLEERMDDLDLKVEAALKEFEHRLDTHWEDDRAVMNTMTHNVQKLLDRQQQNQPAMESLNTLLHAGIALRWAVITVVATLAAVTTASTALDIIRAWLK